MLRIKERVQISNKVIHQITRNKTLAFLQQLYDKREFVFGLTQNHASSQRFLRKTSRKNVVSFAEAY